MSSISSHSEPSHESHYYNIDYSAHKTCIGHYLNNGINVGYAKTFHLQVIQNHPNANDRYKSWEPLRMFLGFLSIVLSENRLDKLREHCSLDATFDASARFDPPRCAEATRIEIFQRIEKWINHNGPDELPASLFWLYGGAGVGKSAIAQTISEKFQGKKNLGATFFFFKNEASRNDGNTLIPTLVWQLVHTFKGLGPFVEKSICANPDLFSKQHKIQLGELLVEPLLLKSKKASSFLPQLLSLSKDSKDTLESRPWLIVIDGLDECKDKEVQSKLLLAIADAIRRIPYPLRFLVTSRPEPHIVRMFNHDHTLRNITADRYNLSDDPDADMDIRKYLEKGFAEIRHSHCLSRHLPHGWPDRSSITSLVERSSGHFIHAATVIRYIQSENHRPDVRLGVILRLLPPQGQDQPYTQLDALYSFIFQGVESLDELEKICLVLGILYVHNHAIGYKRVSYSKCSTIEEILGVKAGDVILILSPILSLVAIKDEEVRILHKSLFDYLLDPTRSGHLPMHLDFARVHELAATYILKAKILTDRCSAFFSIRSRFYSYSRFLFKAIFEFANFAYHCRFGYLNDDLKDYLRDLEVPYPKCITTAFKTPLEMNKLNNTLRAMMSDCFRVLSRDVRVNSMAFII